MKARTKEEIMEFFEKLVGERLSTKGDEKSLGITIHKNGNIEVELYKMYDYFGINYQSLKKISEFFDTENIDVDQSSTRGCETCDYGFKYTHTFYIKP